MNRARISPCKGHYCYKGRNYLRAVTDISDVLRLTRLHLGRSVDSVLRKRPLAISSLYRTTLHNSLLTGSVVAKINTRMKHVLTVVIGLFGPRGVLVNSPLDGTTSVLFPIVSSDVHRRTLPTCDRRVDIRDARFSGRNAVTKTTLMGSTVCGNSLLVHLLRNWRFLAILPGFTLSRFKPKGRGLSFRNWLFS